MGMTPVWLILVDDMFARFDKRLHYLYTSPCHQISWLAVCDGAFV